MIPQSQLREILKANPADARIYFADLFASAGIGWGAFAVACVSNVGVVWAVATLVSALALYRAAYFLHEMAHRKERELPGFVLVWHVLVGVPTLLPVQMIHAHAAHHKPGCYGTDLDPEYEAVAGWGIPQRVLEVLAPGLAPPLLVVRWGVLQPLLPLSSALRELVWSRASTLAINPRYRRPPISEKRRRGYAIQAWACFAWVWLVAVGWGVGLVPGGVLGQLWATMGLALVINSLRTLVSHFFENVELTTMSKEAQLRDSVTIESVPLLSELFWPLGTKFHALHHALPTLPYHALGTVHRELMATLPPDAAYRRTVVRGFWPSMALLWLGRGRPWTADQKPSSP